MVRNLPHKEFIAGSIPAAPTNYHMRDDAAAAIKAHNLEVIGSSPIPAPSLDG